MVEESFGSRAIKYFKMNVKKKEKEFFNQTESKYLFTSIKIKKILVYDYK